MNRTYLIFCLSLAVGCIALQAQTSVPAPTAAPSVSVTATASLVSQYMFRGQRLSGAAFQPAVEVGAGNLVLGAWSNFPFNGDKVPDSSDPEIDLYGSYTIALNDKLSLAPGFTSYHFPKAPTNAGFYRSTFEPNLALSCTMAGIRFTPKFYYDVVLDGATYELAAFYAYPLLTLGTELDFTATIGTYKFKEFANDASPAVKAWGDYWLVGVAMPFQVAANQRVTLGLAYTEGRGAFTKQGASPRSANSLAVGRGVATISYAWTF